MFSRNGIIKPDDQAVVPLTNIAYSYGFGVYENIRVHDNVPFFLAQHIDRLQHSAKIIGLQHAFSEDKVTQYVTQLINSLTREPVNALTDQSHDPSPRKVGTTYNLKLLLIGSEGTNNANLYILPLAPKFTDRKLYRNGIATITVAIERPFPQAKTLSMLGSYLAYTKAQTMGCYDALAVNGEGHVIEGTRTNFFTIKDKTIFTASAKEILEGVTKLVVLHLARQNGYAIQETHVTKDTLPAYDGAFLTSTSSKILPIKTIDDFSYTDIAPSIKELMHIHNDFLKTCAGIFSS